MASVLTFTTILIVVVTSVNSEQTNFLRYSNYLQKAIPNHWQHDKEDLGGRLDTVARWHKVEDVEAPLPPLRQQQEAVWQGWSKRSRLAAMEGARNNDLQKVRRRMLEQKLKLQNLRPKRSVTEMKPENVEKVSEIQSEPNKRTKREAVRESPSQPKAVGQFLEHPDTNTQYQEKVNEKRDKRQILYLIQERPAQIYFKAPRTTRNPFIRETNIQDYEIEKPDNLVQRPVPLPASAEEIDTDSYMINEEASEFSKIISEFYLTTSDETWPEIQQFAENVLKPLSELLQSNKPKWEEKQTNEDQAFDKPKSVNFGNSTTDWYKMSSLKNNLEDLVQKRIKRTAGRVLERGKTLWRKRAKKRKQKQRRVEAKRLRMLTHARRVRKQQKHKRERLQRHYARMNLTTLLPDHTRTSADNDRVTNETERTKGILRESDKAQNKLEGDGKKTNKTEDEYESVEQEESENENSEYDSDEESYYDSDDDSSPDDGNDSYEYEESGDSGSCEDIEYENIDNTNEKKKDKNKKREKITTKTN